MKSTKKIEFAITSYSLAFYAYLLYMYFGVINKFYSKSEIFYIKDFRADNGHYKLLVLLIMLIILTIAFIAYAIYDSKLYQAFGNDEISLDRKHNLFSLTRIIEYAILLAGIMYFTRSTILAFNLDGTLAFAELMNTMAILIMYEMQLIYFTIFMVLIIISFVKSFKNLYY